MTNGLRAIMVCVDYADLLAVTLPWNRHHFDEVLVVTSSADRASRDTALEHGAGVYVTDAFYARGAAFNKWAALEEALDFCDYRRGWLCLMDADVLWPRDVVAVVNSCGLQFGHPAFPDRTTVLEPGRLMTPYRRMLPLKTPFGPADVPPESEWGRFPVHRNVREWAGYSQVFYACDPALPPPPWHDVNLNNAGAADSWFQARWDFNHKVRPPWEVLHLGEAGANWFGRATPRLDGSVPEEAERRRAQVEALWRRRKARRRAGKDPFGAERLPPAGPAG